MCNLLKETLEILRDNEKSEKDVISVIGFAYEAGVPHKIKFSFDDFKKLSDFSYDNGFGSATIRMDLKILGENWWLERAEYDGSEWWEFKTAPKLEDFEDIEDVVEILNAIGR